jgi:hypothetical protein
MEYRGTWNVSSGDFVLTLTNKTAENLDVTDMVHLGTVTRLHLIQVDDSEFIFEFGGMTKRWVRKL